MPEPKIRRATADDADALARCFDAAYAEFRTAIPDLPDISGGMSEEISCNRVWVATLGQKVVGGVVLAIAGEKAHLVNLAVRPAERGSGLGRKLVAVAEAEARASGCATVALATHVKMPQNLRFYAGLGWRETRRDGSKVYMDKPL